MGHVRISMSDRGATATCRWKGTCRQSARKTKIRRVQLGASELSAAVPSGHLREGGGYTNQQQDNEGVYNNKGNKAELQQDQNTQGAAEGTVVSRAVPSGDMEEGGKVCQLAAGQPKSLQQEGGAKQCPKETKIRRGHWSCRVRGCHRDSWATGGYTNEQEDARIGRG